MPEIKRSISSLLTDLAGSEPLVVNALYRLSDLMGDELYVVQKSWPTLPAERRYAVVQHLADIAEENFQVDFSPIFTFCLRDAAADVRRAALEGLWDSEDTSLVPILLGLVQQDPDKDVRAAAAATLGHFVLLSEWQQIPRSAIVGVVEALIPQFENPRNPVVLRRSALEAISSASDDRIQALIEQAYNENDEQLQAAALYAMGNNADRRWIKYVRQEINSDSLVMREEAIRAAGNIESSDRVDENIEQLHQDNDLSIQLDAVTAVGQIGSEQAREILTKLMEDADAEKLQESIEEALEDMDMFNDLKLLDLDLDDEDEEDEEDEVDFL